MLRYFAAWQKRRQRRKDIAELRTMPREQLLDLGITRDDIPAYVAGRAGPAAHAPRQSATIIPFPARAPRRAA